MINNACGEVKQPICGKEAGPKAALWNYHYGYIIGFYDAELKTSEKEKRTMSFIHKDCACLFHMQIQ